MASTTKLRVALTNRNSDRQRQLYVLAAATLLFWMVYVFFQLLQFDAFRSDVKSYWEDSLNWSRPFNSFHVPGYPFIIAILRALTLGILPPLGVMTLINFLASLASALLLYLIAILRALTLGILPPLGVMTLINFLASLASALLLYLVLRQRLSSSYSALGTVLFVLWPFVGLVYGVYPLADMVAVAFLLGGVYALQRAVLPLSGLLFGVALITHKAMWPFAGLLALIWLIQTTDRRKGWKLFLPMVTPIFILWILGVQYHGSALWLLSSNFAVEMQSRSSLPLLDGIAGSLQSGTATGLLKAGIVAVIACASVWLLLKSWRLRTPEPNLGVALSLGVLLLCLVLNQMEIWTAVRFSKLLAIPLMWSIPNTLPRIIERKPILVAVGFTLVASQLIYAWYVVKVFYL